MEENGDYNHKNILKRINDLQLTNLVALKMKECKKVEKKRYE